MRPSRQKDQGIQGRWVQSMIRTRTPRGWRGPLFIVTLVTCGTGGGGGGGGSIFGGAKRRSGSGLEEQTLHSFGRRQWCWVGLWQCAGKLSNGARSGSSVRENGFQLPRVGGALETGSMGDVRRTRGSMDDFSATIGRMPAAAGESKNRRQRVDPFGHGER